MKTTFQLLFTFLLVVFTLNKAQAQLENLTYEVRASNFTYTDSISNFDPFATGLWNIMEFDIYIQQTNIPQNSSEIMRFANAQYYINIDWGYNVGAINPQDSTGFAKFSYIPGSTTFSTIIALPSNPHVKPIAAITDGSAYWPINDIINGIRGGYLNLNSGPGTGYSSDVQISGVFPGTRVGRYKLKKNVTAAFPSPFFAPVYNHLRWRVGPLNPPNNPNPYVKIFAYNDLFGANTDVTDKGTFIMDTLLHPPVLITSQVYLNLKVIMEGLYFPTFNQMSRSDSVTVFLRNSNFPYEIVDSSKNFIGATTFSNYFRFYDLPIDTYYIVVKHFNSLETWSKAGGISILNGSGNNYDFTDSVSKAFGNNLKLKGTKYCLFSGDLNQDGIIDAADLSKVENDKTIGLTGFSISDVNGDYFVDATDLSIVDNNKDNGVIVIMP